MLLSLRERIAILSVLPERGDFVTLKVLNKLQMSLAFTEKEIKEWGIEQNEDGLVTWKSMGEADIPIGEAATGLIIDALRKLDLNKDLSMELLGVYEKFVPTAE